MLITSTNLKRVKRISSKITITLQMNKTLKKQLDWIINATIKDFKIKLGEANDYTYYDYYTNFEYELGKGWWFNKLEFRDGWEEDDAGQFDDELEEEIKNEWPQADRNKRRFKELQNAKKPEILWLEKNNCTKKNIADLELVIKHYKELTPKAKNYHSLDYKIDGNNNLNLTIVIKPDKKENWNLNL